MTIYAYIERPLGELFEPFTWETLPTAYVDEYEAEADEQGRQTRLRFYGEIHSLSREQLDAYNLMQDSEDRSIYLDIQRNRYRIHKQVTDHALRRGRSPATDMSLMGVDGGGPPADVSHQVNGTVADEARG